MEVMMSEKRKQGAGMEMDGGVYFIKGEWRGPL